MLYSRMLIPTSKETPKDAVLKSHKLLLRAGYIHQSGSGIYSLLPLGKIVLDKIATIVRNAMNQAGAQEVLLSFVTPAELWIESGRYEKYGKELLRFCDRKNNAFVLGPTHEESITQLVKSYVKSYKALPLNLYQIQLKFRDEVRPRFGLLRTREFLMKDGYSFHSSQQDLVREFHNMYNAYSKIFSELGLEFRAVEADSGAIGGSGSKEFMVLADSGEDTLVICQSCEYAANIEAAKRAKRAAPEPEPKAQLAKFSTPNVKTIDEVCAFFHIAPYYALKAVVKKFTYKLDASKQDSHTPESTQSNISTDFAVFFLRGDDSLEEIKALNALSVQGFDALEIIDASEPELEALGLHAGSIGAVGLRNLIGNRPIIFDEDLYESSGLICGGNEKDTHIVGVDLGEFASITYAPLASVRESDICACCGGKLTHKKGIEVGHIFQLGTKYSSAMGAEYLGEDARPAPFIMGCYGIGISRLLPAILEQKADEKGCVWSAASAPFMVQIIIANCKQEEQRQYGMALYENLQSRGITTLCDDRDARFGAKMADFELVGAAVYGVVVGKSLESGKIELIARDGLERKEIDSHNAAEQIAALVSNSIQPANSAHGNACQHTARMQAVPNQPRQGRV